MTRYRRFRQHATPEGEVRAAGIIATLLGLIAVGVAVGWYLLA